VSISIVIPTHNRYQKLGNLLASIRKNWNDEIASVIVVDDSDEKSSLSGSQDLRLRHIMIRSRIFISKAKNIGWRSSESEYVCFIDDDNVVVNVTMTPLLDLMRRSDSVGAVMPAVFYKSKPELVWVYSTPFLNSRLDLNLVGRNLPRNPKLEGRLLKTDALPNASLVRKRALEEVGGFDERLLVNSSLDLVQRLKTRGWQVVSHTGAWTFHDVEVPGRIGWWAIHGSVDPERVRYELRDWFLIMRKLHPKSKLSGVRAPIESLRFILPNLLAYLLRGRQRLRVIRSLLVGYVEGVLSAD